VTNLSHKTTGAPAILVVVAMALWPLSCDKGDAGGTASQEFEIEKRYQRGPISVELRASRKEITIADRLTLVIQAEVQEDYEVGLPKFGAKLQQFGIVDYVTAPPRLADNGRVVSRRSYVLEPFLSGEYEIPPMTITFWKKGDPDGKKHEIQTETITIQVASLLPAKAAELEIKDIAGPLDIPAPRRLWLYAAISAAVTVLASTVALVVWRRRRRERIAGVPRIPAHELAYDRLEKLLGEKLIENGRFKDFYRGISDILRHYIENRFGLCAPERTTEEFLEELRCDDVLAASHKDLLTEFLRHCDLVKFAELQPGEMEIQQTFNVCKRLIMETASEEARVPRVSAG